MGLAFELMGIFLIFAGTGLIPSDSDSFHGPPWVVALWGSAFAAVGLLLIAPSPVMRHLLGGAVLMVMGIGFGWLALTPPERRGPITGPDITLLSVHLTGDQAGRIGFGFLGLVVIVAAVWVWVQVALLFLSNRS